MNQQWLEFLRGRGARSDTGNPARITGFGDRLSEIRAAVDGGARIDLSGMQAMEVAGPDAAAFLQGQFTADVATIGVGQSRLAAHLSVKGRIQFIVRLTRIADDRFSLVVPAPLAEGARRRLSMFLLRSRARIESAESAVAIGVSGSDGLHLLAGTGARLPQSPDTGVADAERILISVPGPVPRMLGIMPEPQARALWQALDPLPPAPADAWQFIDIAAGIPSVGPATVDLFLPQMLNLQILDGVSFSKGCYIGQEIVARSEYLGRLKRRMYRARTRDDHPLPEAGEIVHSPQAGPSEEAGRIVAAAPHPDGGHALLVCALVRCAEGGSLHRADAAGPELEIEPLPYPLPQLPAG